MQIDTINFKKVQVALFKEIRNAVFLVSQKHAEIQHASDADIPAA